MAGRTYPLTNNPYDVSVIINGTDILAIDNRGKPISIGTAGTDDRTIISDANDMGDRIFLSRGTYYITDDLTIDEGKTLIFSDGAIFSVASEKTLTINCAVQANHVQIFAGDGTVSGSPICDYTVPEWFGAIGNGTTNDAAAIQAAANLARYCSGFTLLIPPNTYFYDSDINIYSHVKCFGKLIKEIVIDDGQTVLESGNVYRYYPVSDAKIIINYDSRYSLDPTEFSGINEFDVSIPNYEDVPIVGGGTIDLESGGVLVVIDTDYFTSRNNGEGDEYYSKMDACQIVSDDGYVFPEFCFGYEDISPTTVNAWSSSTVYAKGDYVKIGAEGTDIYKAVFISGPGTQYTSPIHGTADIGYQSPETGLTIEIEYPDETTAVLTLWVLVKRIVYYYPPNMQRLIIDGVKIEILNGEEDSVKRRVNSNTLQCNRSNVTFKNCAVWTEDVNLMLSQLIGATHCADLIFESCYTNGALYYGLGYNYNIANCANLR
ncbi:MAG: hypothetical protein M0R06_26870, partial [Sphaerochaeta sp.]|nr:hypothetical protein [Sphaerochaeta sp.]